MNRLRGRVSLHVPGPLTSHGSFSMIDNTNQERGVRGARSLCGLLAWCLLDPMEEYLGWLAVVEIKKNIDRLAQADLGR